MWTLTRSYLVLLLLLTDGLRGGHLSLSVGNAQTFEEQLTREYREYCPRSKPCKSGQPPPRRTSQPFGGSCCRTCQCEEHCLKYSTCCPDSEHFKQQRPRPELRCVDWAMKPRKADSEAMVMVADCAAQSEMQGVDPSYVSKCQSPSRENLRENIPVSSPASVYVYRNVYCALCNGQTNTTNWRVSIWSAVSPLSNDYTSTVTDINSTYKEAIDWNNDDLNVIFFPADLATFIFPPTCESESIRRCNSTGLQTHTDAFLESACPSFRSPMAFDTSESTVQSYYNVFCALCNGQAVDSSCRVLSSVTFIPPGFMAFLHYGDEAESSPVTPNHQGGPEGDSLCDSGSFFDPLTDGCRPWLCPKGFVKGQGECRPVLVNMFGFKIVVLVKGRVIGEAVELSLEKMEAQGESLVQDLTRCHNDIEARLVLNQVSSPVPSEGHMIPYYIFVFTYALAMFDEGEYKMRLLLDCVGRLEPTELTTRSWLQYEQAEDVALYKDPPIVRYFPRAMTLLDMENGGRILLDHYTSQRPVAASYILRASKFFFCNQVQLSEEEISIENGQLLFLNSEVTLSPSMYTTDVTQGRVHVCVADYLEAMKKVDGANKKKSNVSRMVSVAFSCASIFCLVTALVAIVCFPGLQTLFGKVSFAFLCHLLWTQILTVSALTMDVEESPGLCTALGIAVHVSWLATAALNTVFCSRRYVNRLFQVSLEQALPDRCRFIILTLLLGYLPSMLLLGLTFGLSLYLSVGVEVGYGLRHCSIDSMILLSCLFLAPLVLSLMASCVLDRVSRPSVTTTKEDQRSFAWPSVQLGVCYNLVWICWFLKLLSGHSAYEYLFWVFNTILCFVALVEFVVKPKIQASQAGAPSET